MSAEIIGNVCPPRCNAGGTEQHGGHVFDQHVEFYRCLDCGEEWGTPSEITSQTDTDNALRRIAIAHAGTTGCKLHSGVDRSWYGAFPSRYVVRLTGGSLVCRCGLSAMDWSLMTGP